LYNLYFCILDKEISWS